MTRKLLGLSLLAILLLTGFAFGQNFNVWYGGSFVGSTWTDTTYVTIPSPWNQATNVDIPVFAQGDAGTAVADLHLPLGVLDANIDAIPAALCTFNYWPFNGPAAPPDTGAGWDEISFLTTFEPAPPNVPGYHSRSFFGISTTGGGPNRMIYPTPTPQQILKFVVSFPVVDTLVTYNPLRDGYSSTLMGPAAGDELGGAGFPVVTHHSFIKFVAQHNLAPVISPIADVTNHLAVPTFTVIDADGPAPLLVTADHGTVNNLGGGNYSITLEAGYCGLVTITAEDGADAVSTGTFTVLNSAPVITYLGPNPVVATSVVGFDIVDANNDMITPVVSGACVVTITTNVAGHLAGTIACVSSCNGTININATDPCGAAATPVSFVVNILNAAPVINASIAGGAICGVAQECYPVVVTDDGIGDIVVTSTAGIITMTSYVKVPGVSTVWTGTLCVDLTQICAPWESAITINATDGMDAAVPYTTGIFELTPTIKVDLPDDTFDIVDGWQYQGFWPGYVDSIPVYMDAAGCFCMGGFELTVMYDASMFTLLRVTRGSVSVGAEYFYTNYNPPIAYCPENYGRTGAVKVVMAWDLPNQTDPPRECPNVGAGTILFWLVGQVPNGAYQTNFCVPICFYACGANDDCGAPFDPNGMNYQWNAITNETGFNVWKTEGCCDTDLSTYFLDLNCGNIKVNVPGDVPPGDVNHNGQPWEIGDVVALANYLGGIGTLDHYQWWASDINGDGNPATIADLVMLIRVVTNQMPIPNHKVAPIDVAADVNLTGNDLTISSEANLGGAVVSINYTGEIGVPTANGMDIKYSEKNGVLTVVAYSLAGNALGNNISINVPIVSGTATLASASVADINGALLNAKVTAPLPTNFSVAQNYPNPFNVKTAIKVALPTSAVVNVTIYNVAGQLVQTINAGELAAGEHSIIWDASNVGSGVYFYKVAAGDQTRTLKMTLLK